MNTGLIVNDDECVDELVCNECGRRVGLWNYSGTLSEVCDVGLQSNR